MGFYVYHRSYLLWPPVLPCPRGAVGRRLSKRVSSPFLFSPALPPEGSLPIRGYFSCVPSPDFGSENCCRVTVRRHLNSYAVLGLMRPGLSAAGMTSHPSLLTLFSWLNAAVLLPLDLLLAGYVVVLILPKLLPRPLVGPASVIAHRNAVLYTNV